MVEEMLAARGILVSHETVRQWGLKFGQAFANRIRRRLPAAGDKWRLDEVVISIAGRKHWLWRAGCPPGASPALPGPNRPREGRPAGRRPRPGARPWPNR